MASSRDKDADVATDTSSQDLNVVDDMKSRRELRGLGMQVYACGAASMAFLSVGGLLGWSSPALPRLLSGEEEPNLTSSQGAWVASFQPLGQMLGAVPAGFMVERLGRKTTLLLCAPLFLASWVLAGSARTASLLMAARAIGGLGAGIGYAAAPLYLGEVAEPRIRGFTASLLQLALNASLLFEYCLGPRVSASVLAYASACLPAIFALTFAFAPESPYFHAARGRFDLTRRALGTLRGYSPYDPALRPELDQVKAFVAAEEGNTRCGGGSMIVKDPASRKALVVVLALAVFGNLSGIFAILSYSTEIFQTSDSSDPATSVIIMGIMLLVMGFIAPIIIGKFTRRTCLIISTVGCAIAHLSLGVYFYLATVRSSKDMEVLSWLPVTATVLFVIAFTLGLGPFPMTITGELFASSVRGLASTVVSMALGGGALITTKCYQLGKDAWGEHVMFWIFSGSCAVGTLFAIFVLPETSNRTLEQIQNQLAGSKSRSNGDCERAAPKTEDTIEAEENRDKTNDAT